MYQPEENPLKGLHSKRDADEIDRIVWDYMLMWDDELDFRDISKIVASGDAEMLADYLVGAGAVDSKECVRTCAAIERRIEKLAASYAKLSRKQQQKRQDEVFGDCTIYICQNCGHHHFVNQDDCVSAEEMATCVQCDGPTKSHKWGEEY